METRPLLMGDIGSGRGYGPEPSSIPRQRQGFFIYASIELNDASIQFDPSRHRAVI
jgi:hypothetical protein